MHRLIRHRLHILFIVTGFAFFCFADVVATAEGSAEDTKISAGWSDTEENHLSIGLNPSLIGEPHQFDPENHLSIGLNPSLIGEPHQPAQKISSQTATAYTTPPYATLYPSHTTTPYATPYPSHTTTPYATLHATPYPSHTTTAYTTLYPSHTTTPYATLHATPYTISGTLRGMPNQSIRLEAFNGLQTYLISETTTDNDGTFTLTYSDNDLGVGYLVSDDDNPFIVILSGETIRLSGNALIQTGTMEVLEGQENQWFGTYASEHPRREQSLSAWVYLEKIYDADSLFAIHEEPKRAIEREKQRIRDEDQAFLDALPEDSYVHWFLPVRRLVSSVSVVAQYRTEEIPATIQGFRNVDMSDDRLYRSGLFRDVLESHYWLIENSGRSLDSVYVEMGVSIDEMMEDLADHDARYREVTDFLFNLFEKRSLFTAAEHLALLVLEDDRVNLGDRLAKKMETYRAVKKGNIAADILFGNGLMVGGGVPQGDGDPLSDSDLQGDSDPQGDGTSQGNTASQSDGMSQGDSRLPSSLSDFSSDFTVIYFGSSSSSVCRTDVAEMANHYDKWRREGVEVLFVSLDDPTSEAAFRQMVSGVEFPVFRDGLSWDSPVVDDYHVYKMPEIYLLDSKREILLRPKTVKQMDAWVDWYLVQGNLRR